MVPLALGTQTNGSVIRPAAFCGVFAVKPTHGLVSRAGVLQLSRSSTMSGPFARSLPDLALILDVLAGHDPADPDTRPFASADFRAVQRESSPASRISLSCARRSGTRPSRNQGGVRGTVTGRSVPRWRWSSFPLRSPSLGTHRTIMATEMAHNLAPLSRAASRAR
jgi:hypothetical protein